MKRMWRSRAPRAKERGVGILSLSPFLIMASVAAFLNPDIEAASRPAGGSEIAGIAIPADFRRWTHVKSGVVLPGNPETAAFAGFHHIHANEAALSGYRTGNFPDGAIIVFDLFEIEGGAGTLRAGRRKAVDVMVRHASRYAATGGWGFEEFGAGDPERPVVRDVRSQCLDCHVRAAGGDLVFSSLAE